MDIWTNEEIENILIQLDAMELPFSKYGFHICDEKLKLLGKGGSSLVYEAGLRGKKEKEYVIKVIGFGEGYLDSEDFKASVEVQKDLSRLQDNIVRVFTSQELFIWPDEKGTVIKAQLSDGGTREKNCLRLQFVVMEKLVPVFQREKSGKIHLYPQGLEDKDAEEIYRFAYDLGCGIHFAHEHQVLHRDVKLENVFYCPKKKRYKLGDFGIAKVMDNGLASTTAFTKGYGAPEVVISQDEKYDNTADIYSFGMMLYLLLNNLQFPASHTYQVNARVQYQKGYILTEPLTGNSDIFELARKMCMYHPDDRYQTMEEVLKVLEGLFFNEDIAYKRKHRKISLVLGTLFALAGSWTGALVCYPGGNPQISVSLYVLIALNLYRFVRHQLEKETIISTLLIGGVGILWLLGSGFSWTKLLLLLLVVCFDDFGGIVCGMLLAGKIGFYLGQQNPAILLEFSGLYWLVIALLSWSGVLLLQYMVLQINDRFVMKLYFKHRFYWILVYVWYLLCVLMGGLLERKNTFVFLNEEAVDLLVRAELQKVGCLGILFCTIWVVREGMLLYMEKKKTC